MSEVTVSEFSPSTPFGFKLRGGFGRGVEQLSLDRRWTARWTARRTPQMNHRSILTLAARFDIARESGYRVPHGCLPGLWLQVDASRRRNDPRKGAV